MASPKMIKMGIKRKEMYPAEITQSSEKNYDKQEVRPELTLDGPHAEMMGAEELKVGDRIRQTVEWEVKRVSSTTTDGKTTHSLTLCLDKGSDMEDCGEGDSEDADEGSDGEDSPAMAYIQGRAKEA